MRSLLCLTLCLILSSGVRAATLPRAIFTDPPADQAHPAAMQVLHIPSGGTTINGIAYLPSGPGPFPVLVLCHGLPGNEKNLDLAQAARRAGWVAVSFNYRGSWGSPGTFSFSGNLDDAAAVLAYLRDPAQARALRADAGRIAIFGHSMGGWVAARTAERDAHLVGAILLSAADFALLARMSHADLVADMADNMEALAGVTAESMAHEVESHAASYGLTSDIGALRDTPLLVLSADDGLAPHTDALVAAIRAKGGAHVTAVHVATDHGWSDRRIELESRILRWLEPLANAKR